MQLANAAFATQVKITLCLVLVVTVVVPPAAGQDLFDTSRGARTYGNLRTNDQGSMFRGGANFSPFREPTSATVFQGGVSADGMCNFDLLAGFVEKFEELPELLLQLAGPIAFGFALQILCESAPSWCDIIKQIYQSANLTLRAQFGRCQDLVLTGMSLATASQREALKKCVEDKQAAGTTIERAMQDCPAEINAPGGINGIEEPEFGIVEQALASSGVDPALIGAITRHTGDVRLSADGTVFSQSGSKEKDNIFSTYQEELTEAVEAVSSAVASLAGGSLPSDEVLTVLGGPGFPASADALMEMAQEPHPELRAYEIQRYAGNITYARMVWGIHELANTLQDVTESAAMSPEIRANLQQKKQALERQVARIQDMRQASKYMEDHVGELLARRARREQEVANVANAGQDGALVGRYPGGQTGLGYTR